MVSFMTRDHSFDVVPLRHGEATMFADASASSLFDVLD